MVGELQGRFPCSKLKLDNLFLQWLSTPSSQTLVAQELQKTFPHPFIYKIIPHLSIYKIITLREVFNLLEDARHGRPLQGPLLSGNSSPMSPTAAQNFFFATPPPLSPPKKLSPQSPRSPRRQCSSTFLRSQVLSKGHIPVFYYPSNKPLSPRQFLEFEAQVDTILARHGGQISVPALKELMTEVLELPGILAYPLYVKLHDKGPSGISKDDLLSWTKERNIVEADPMKRLFDVLRQSEEPYITQADLKQLLSGVLLSHPGLEFLQETPEFQERYADTVIYRIMYKLDRTGLGRLYLRDLKRGDLLEALRHLEREEDVNKVLKYFSYEHFYVIYCKFWELDSDHDFVITKDDLIKYGNHSLTYRIVDRIFQQGTSRSQTDSSEGKMTYRDFVWFILSEEDKGNDVSLEYWFRCIDLDDDGELKPNEMLYFYEEQLHRMECLAQEPVMFEDVLCQMHDMIRPAQEGCFTLQDLKHGKALSGTLFNILFNLNKFVAFETRDPFLIRQERDDAGLTEWDRFAKTEYIRLAMEEEGEGDDMSIEPQSSNPVWESETEAPF